MASANSISCPQCGMGIEVQEVLTLEYKKELRQQMQEYQKKQEEKIKQKENELQEVKRRQSLQEQEWKLQQQEALARLNEENARQLNGLRDKIEAEYTEKEKQKAAELEERLTKAIHNDYANKLAIAEEEGNRLKHREAELRQKELEQLRLMQELKAKDEMRELEHKKQLLEERQRAAEEAKKHHELVAEERFATMQQQNKELQLQLEQQRRLAEEMKRKAEQGSMQLQGEAQEIILEETLRNHFIFDKIEEVGKGIRGADCVQTIRNNFGAECGRIIYESKRTTHFSHEWIEKLKKDMRTMNIDVAVIVTQAMPKEHRQFCNIDGIWVCSFTEVLPLAMVLREGILKLHMANRNNENKGEKMAMLYDYLVGSEFKQQWIAVAEGFTEMRKSLTSERVQMEKIWKTREKQLEKVLLNASGIQGSIEGIAGRDNIQLDFGEEQQVLIS